ncbi:hypothetical protein HYPSUDRAFT_540036 [Hypholoma sublateritium FD-334 SS-4]|uniref:Uncharacterized protein n=1 Tax=Hypholoma sublateritium (strain FD-334 SS-4) TaxID=945553 RepID=A0A0D2PY00_HYPSF|nr:hypothetical protein HYPSUDRAFT_540036 [Hypholoma sublateritium FD-334 SS-4]
MFCPCLVLEFTWHSFTGPSICSLLWASGSVVAYIILRNLSFVFSRSAELNEPLHFWHLGLWIRTYGTLSTYWATALRLARRCRQFTHESTPTWATTRDGLKA